MKDFLSLEHVVTVLLGILGFVGALGVNALMSIAKSVNEIKIDVKAMSVRQDDHERRIEKLEDE